MALKRRDVVLGTGALLAAAAVTTASAETHDGAHAGHSAQDPPLLDEASDCVRIGEICLDHCFQLLATGDTALAECGRSVNEMVGVSGALTTLAAAASPRLSAIAKASVPVYQHCEAECRKHAPKHAICGRCGDACTAILKAIAASVAKT